jgi:hypothetical protein
MRASWLCQNRIRAERAQQRGQYGCPQPKAEQPPQPVEQCHRRHTKPDAGETQRKLARPDGLQPAVLKNVAGDGVRLVQVDGCLDDLSGCLQAEEIAKGLIAAQFLLGEPVQAQCKCQQQQAEQRQPRRMLPGCAATHCAALPPAPRRISHRTANTSSATSVTPLIHSPTRTLCGQ